MPEQPTAYDPDVDDDDHIEDELDDDDDDDDEDVDDFEDEELRSSTGNVSEVDDDSQR